MKDFFRVVLCATVLLSSTAAIAQCPNGMVIRKEFRQLSLVEWEKFVDAVRALNVGPTPTLYDRQVAIRKWKTVNTYSMSLPFDRLYLREFEEKLQEQGHDTTISLPYWDWTLDAYDPESSPIFTAGWLGGNGAPGTHRVTDGPFANWPVFYPQPHRLRRDFGAPGTHFADEAAVREMIETFTSYPLLDNYIAFRDRLERMASDVRVWIGGDMGRKSFSPNDPIFWLHRAFVDKLWAERQKYFPQFANDFPLSTTSRVPHYSIPVSEVFDTEHLCYNYDAFVFE